MEVCFLLHVAFAAIFLVTIKKTILNVPILMLFFDPSASSEYNHAPAAPSHILFFLLLRMQLTRCIVIWVVRRGASVTTAGSLSPGGVVNNGPEDTDCFPRPAGSAHLHDTALWLLFSGLTEPTWAEVTSHGFIYVDTKYNGILTVQWRHRVLLLRGVPYLLLDSIPSDHIIRGENAHPGCDHTGPPALISRHKRVFGQHLHQVALPQAELIVRSRLVVEHGRPETRRGGIRIGPRADAILRCRPAENVCFFWFLRGGHARLGTQSILQTGFEDIHWRDP